MKTAVAILLAALSVLYPLLVAWGLPRYDARWLGAAALVLVLLRLALVRPSMAQLRSLLPLVPGPAIVCLLVVLFDSALMLLCIPVVVAIGMLVAFAVSLVRPPSMIERFARLSHGDALPAPAIPWCRGVTKVWCGFFVLNITVSTATIVHAQVTGSLWLWTAWNGAAVYGVLGVLFGGEFLLRQRYIARHQAADAAAESAAADQITHAAADTPQEVANGSA